MTSPVPASQQMRTASAKLLPQEQSYPIMNAACCAES